MRFDHIRLFRDIAQRHSLRLAAALNGVSQPTTSQHIHEIEARSGGALLDRSVRPLALTPAGRLYAELCRDVLHRQVEFDLALETLKNQVAGAVKVAFIYSVGLTEMPGIKEEFARRCPLRTPRTPRTAVGRTPSSEPDLPIRLKSNFSQDIFRPAGLTLRS